MERKTLNCPSNLYALPCARPVPVPELAGWIALTVIVVIVIAGIQSWLPGASHVPPFPLP